MITGLTICNGLRNNPLCPRLSHEAGPITPWQINEQELQQSPNAEQALVEITANGMDAVDAWISRFGLGFYQTLAQLKLPGEQVLFAGETPDGQRIGLMFRLGADQTLEARPMLDGELKEFLGKDRRTTKVRVQRAMSTEAQRGFRRYLADRVAGSRRMRIHLEGEATPLNSLEGFYSATNVRAPLTYLLLCDLFAPKLTAPATPCAIPARWTRVSFLRS